MNISCSINVCDPVQLKAYIDFMHALGGQSAAVTTTEAEPAPVDKPKAARAKVEKAETVEAAPAPVQKEKAAIKGLDLEHLRGRVGGFIKTRPETREAIKAALSTHGAASVSTLDPSDFESFNNFLDTL